MQEGDYVFVLQDNGNRMLLSKVIAVSPRWVTIRGGVKFEADKPHLSKTGSRWSRDLLLPLTPDNLRRYEKEATARLKREVVHAISSIPDTGDVERIAKVAQELVAAHLGRMCRLWAMLDGAMDDL